MKPNTTKSALTSTMAVATDAVVASPEQSFATPDGADDDVVVLSGESSKRKRSAYEDSEELFENFTASYNELAVHFMELQKHLKTRLDAAIKTSADQADTIAKQVKAIADQADTIAKQVKEIADQHTKIKRQEEIINEREAELSSAQSARDDAENRLQSIQNHIDLKQFSLPQYDNNSNHVITAVMPETDPRYAILVKQIMSTRQGHRLRGGPIQQAPKIKIKSIHTVHNKSHQDDYLKLLSKQSELEPYNIENAIKVQSIHNKNMNEYLLFHGAPSHSVFGIIREGVDPRMAGTHRGKRFGAGSYFTSLSSKSDIYTKPLVGGDERCIIVLRVFVGDPYETHTGLANVTMPPDGKDSVVALTKAEGGSVDYPEFVCYNIHQALPEYTIYYTHEDSCKCTHCHSP